jgi:hypothetical protein
VVGESLYFDGHAHYYKAFIYMNGTMTNLNNLLPPDSHWSLTYANGINDAGQITGYGYNNGSTQPHAYVLTLDSAPGANVSNDLSGGLSEIATDLTSSAQLSLPIVPGGSGENLYLTSPEISATSTIDVALALPDSGQAVQFSTDSPQIVGAKLADQSDVGLDVSPTNLSDPLA